jgi:peptide/nickel transport system substrate-binding protein/oligopeptide transport system substrate-binding protein
VLGIAWLVASPGCGQHSSKPAVGNAELPRDGGTFRMEQDEPDRLDPACVDDAYEAFLVNQIFDGLVGFDAHLNTVPSIASSWIISPDGKTYTFELKSGVRFHDGTEVVADDVVFSLTRVFDLPEEQAGLARQYLCHILGAADYAAKKIDRITGLEAPSSHQVRITLDHPYAPFLAVLASEMARVVPKRHVQRLGDLEFARHPIGSGPFVLAEWTPHGRAVLTAFRAPGAQHVHLDSIVIGFPPGNVRECAAQCFLNGKLSAVVIPAGRKAEFQRHPQRRSQRPYRAERHPAAGHAGLHARIQAARA